MDQLPVTIRNRLDILAAEFNKHLQELPGPVAPRDGLAAGRRLLELTAAALEASDGSPLIGFVHDQWPANWMPESRLQALSALEETLLALLPDDHTAAAFLWRLLAEARATVLKTGRRGDVTTGQNTIQMLQTVLDHFPGIVFWKDRNCVYLGCNKVFAAGAGLASPLEIIGKTDYDLPWAATEADAYRADDQRVMTSRTPKLHFVEPQLQADGHVAWFETNSVPLLDDNGEVVGIMGTAMDITERKQLELQLQQLLERRGRQVRLATEIAQNVAAATDLTDLYTRVVTEVKEQFGYYQAQLLRYEPAEEVVALVAASGQVGKQMLEQGHRMPLGVGLIGTAAATGVSVLRPDVVADPDWQPNPLLPATRGELAVPIKLGREDAGAQLMGLRYFTRSNFDGIAVAALDPGGVGEVARAALQQGTPVVAMSADLGQANQTALVYGVEYEMGHMLGRQAGEWARQHLSAGETLKVGVLNYRFIPQVVQRETGIIEGIKAIFGREVEVVGSETAGDPAQGRVVAEKWLRLRPDLQMIVGINDGGALGAYQAVIAAGKDDPERFFVGGIDAVQDALAAIQSGGAYQATVEQSPAMMGILAVRVLVAAIKDLPYDPVNVIPSLPVNRSNIDTFLRADHQAALAASLPIPAEALAGLDLAGLRLGLSVFSLSNPFFAALAEAAQQEARRLGIQLMINDPQRVLGVLDIQSDTPGLLSAEDQLAMEGLCGQIAVAIESTRLRQEMEENLRELRAMQRAMSREGWAAFRETAKLPGGYLFDRAEIRPADDLWLPEMEVALAQRGLVAPDYESAALEPAENARAAVAPLIVQDEAIGLLGLYDDPQHPLSQADLTLVESVSEQVALALESARLFEQTQATLAETELLYRASAELNIAQSYEEILAVLRRYTLLGRQAHNVSMARFDRPWEEEHKPEWIDILVRWSQLPQEAVSTRYRLADFSAENLLRSDAPTLVEDVGNDPRVDEQSRYLYSHHFGARSTVFAPLVVGGQWLGFLNAVYPESMHFAEAEVRRLVTLTGQAAVAVQTIYLVAQTQEALATAENLYEAGQRINAATDLQEVVTAVAEDAPVAVINRVLLLLFARDAAGEVEAADVVANWYSGTGTPPPAVGTCYSRTALVAMRLLLGSEPLFVDDIQNDARIDDPATLALAQKDNLRAVAILPLWIGTRQLGVLMLQAEETHCFTEREIQPYLSLAPQVAVAVDNQRLLIETRAALAAVEATQRRYTLQAWEAYLARRSAAVSYEQAREGLPPLGETLPAEVGQALAQRATVVTPAQHRRCWGSAKTGNGHGQVTETGSSLIVPLTLRGEIIGVLGLQETDPARQWSPEEVALVEAIGQQFAQAAEGLRLLDESQQRAAREARVNEIAAKIQGAHSLEEALSIAVREVGLSLQAPETTVELNLSARPE